MSDGWVDISVPLRSGMLHWPGDEEVEISRAADMDSGDDANLTHLRMSAHTGTHIDAPLHFLHNAPSIDRMPLSAMVGPAQLLVFPDVSEVTAEDLKRYEINSGERLLIKTSNSSQTWHERAFDKNFVHLSTDAAAWLAEQKVQLVGIDYLSVAGYQKNETEVHEALLGAGIWILEGLDLSRVGFGRYELLCLPLKLVGADGAPARALARPISHG